MTEEEHSHSHFQTVVFSRVENQSRCILQEFKDQITLETVLSIASPQMSSQAGAIDASHH